MVSSDRLSRSPDEAFEFDDEVKLKEDAKRVAVVTGAASGIGRAACEKFAAAGWNALAVDMDEDALEWTEHAAGVAPFPADISSEAANAAMLNMAAREFGHVDSVVLNAALSLNGGIESFSMEDFDKLMAVNLRGTVLGIRAAIPLLRRNGGGSIVVTSSTHGLAGDVGFWAYAASKHGLVGIVKCVAREVAWESIRINAICPGPVRATGLSTEFETKVPDTFKQISQAIPAKRWGEPAEIAEAIFFLSSPGASYVNGIAMPVDGGTLSGTGCLPPADAQ